MAELNVNNPHPVRKRRHRDRLTQIPIYLGKQFRFFINQSDWKVIPMAAVIAALVAMVVRKRMFQSMEGTLIGAFALACVSIWNGCFNSIQSICRERPIIKREHRSGMHVSSYMAAHMIYQLLLCLGQTGITMYVLISMGVPFPYEGFMTSWMVLDIGISMLLISYASDMLSLFISSLCHTTTGAMTVMPFVLIFQLVFSGGLIPLPEGVRPLSNFTVSTYGIAAIAAQSGYNELPMNTGWDVLEKMQNNEVGGTVTVGQVLDLLKSPVVDEYRDREIVKPYTVGEAAEILNSAEAYLHLRDIRLGDEYAGMTLGQVLDALQAGDAVEAMKDEQLNPSITLGQIVDILENNVALQARQDREFTFKATVSDLMNLVGKENVETLVKEKTAAASRNAAYDSTVENVAVNWAMLGVFIFAFALLATISLELIDKDKR